MFAKWFLGYVETLALLVSRIGFALHSLIYHLPIQNEWAAGTVSQSLLQAPTGYHSTRGDLGKCGGRGHGALNYREWAVYDERACVPVHLIVYSYTSTTE